MLSLAAVSLAAPARRTGHTLAAYTTDSDLQLEELEGLGKGYGKLKVSSVCAPSDSQFWLLGTHHKTGTELGKSRLARRGGCTSKDTHPPPP